jgi:hypothetical protein
LRISLGVKRFDSAGIACFVCGAGCKRCGGWMVRSMLLPRYREASKSPGFIRYLESVIEAGVKSPIKGMWI